MKKFTCAADLGDVDIAVQKALEMKKSPYSEKHL